MYLVGRYSSLTLFLTLTLTPTLTLTLTVTPTLTLTLVLALSVALVPALVLAPAYIVCFNTAAYIVGVNTAGESCQLPSEPNTSRVRVKVRGEYFHKLTHSASTHNQCTQTISLVGCR